MKIIDIDLRENGKKYFCKQANEVFKVEKGNLIASRKSFSMADLLKFDFEEIKETKNPYTRVDYKDWYYAIERAGSVTSLADNSDYDDRMFNIANYFNNKNYAEYVGFKETLMRKLDKFAWEHNEQTISWNDCRHKYFILFSIDDNELIVDWNRVYKSNNVYFTSREIAEQALEKFKDDLMKLYTWKFDF
jgi:hypothetical protein|nr:MAG TPA: hypothetical protein [Caudoviricetes sp.]